MALRPLCKKICTSLCYSVLIVVTFESRALTVESSCTGSSLVTIFLATNSTEGTTLIYKDSFSNSSGIVDFSGYFISSAFSCGSDFQRCPNLTVISEGDKILVVIPLAEFIGVASFETRDGILEFQRKAVVDLTSLNLDCEVSSIFSVGGNSGQVSFIADCLYQEENSLEMQLDIIQVILHSTNLSVITKEILNENSLLVQPLSNSVFFMSNDFQSGVSAFASGTTIYYIHLFSLPFFIEYHSMFDSCSAVQQLSLVSPNYLALYCLNQTIQFNLVGGNPKEFITAEDGFPIFCSSSTFYRYLLGALSLHQIDENRTQIGSAVNLLDSNESIKWGKCIKERYVVLYSNVRRVIVYDAHSSNSCQVSMSKVTPRIFEESFILLKNESHALVYDIQSAVFVEDVPQDFDMGYVLGEPRVGGNCVRVTSSPTSDASLPSGSTDSTDNVRTPQPGSSNTAAIVAASVVVVVIFLAIVLVAMLCSFIYYKRRNRRNDPGTTAASNHLLTGLSSVDGSSKVPNKSDFSETSLEDHTSASISDTILCSVKFPNSCNQEQIDEPRKATSAEEYCQINKIPTLELAGTKDFHRQELDSSTGNTSGIYRQESQLPGSNSSGSSMVHAHQESQSPGTNSSGVSTVYAHQESQPPGISSEALQESHDNSGMNAAAVVDLQGVLRTPNLPRQEHASAASDDDHPDRGVQEQGEENNSEFVVTATPHEEVNGAARDNQNQDHLDKL